MTHEFEFTFLNCQSCTAKVHCDECEENLAARLLLRSGIQAVEIDMQNKRLAVQSGMDGDELLDLLEEVSIFAD